MSERSGLTPMTPEALRAIARQASSDHFTQGTDLTTAVVKAASLTGMPLTNEHVRRVCEMTYHDAFERAWRETPGQDRYVSFDPPDAVLASQQINAVKVASTSRRSAMQVVTASSTEKVASASRRFDTRAAYGRAVDAAFAPVENPAKIAYANPLGEVQALRSSMREAITELEAREATLSSSDKYASAELAAQAEQACKEGHKVGQVLFACVSPFETAGYDKVAEDLVHELAAHLVGHGFSVSTREKTGSAQQVNPNHPLPIAFEKVASFRREHVKVAMALESLRRDYSDLRRRIDALGH
jgi:hypothetical protein